MNSPGSSAHRQCRSVSPLNRRFASQWPFTRLGRPFWIFFSAALLLDFGFDLYFFLYNLFLLNLRYDERAIGMIGSSLTLGNLAGTIPVAMLSRRFGLQKPLLFCFIAAPIICIVRVQIPWMAGQVIFAFLTGIALSAWPVCFAPAVAKLTTDETRVFAFSITFATGIGTGTLAGIAGGYIPVIFHSASKLGSLTAAMRIVLIGAAGIAMIGAYPISKLRIAAPPADHNRRLFVFHPFLLRFLPAFAVWSLVTGSFVPFAPVFFQKQLGISLPHVGLIFSASELVQFCAVLLVPFLYRKIGAMAGIVVAQLASAGAALALARAHSAEYAISSYLVFAGAQFTAGPGFYGMLMSRTPERDRSSASAMQNIAGALSQAGASALTGVLIVRSGYGSVFAADVALIIVSTLLALLFLSDPTHPRISIRSLHHLPPEKCIGYLSALVEDGSRGRSSLAALSRDEDDSLTLQGAAWRYDLGALSASPRSEDSQER
jgi:MFS family permease